MQPTTSMRRWGLLFAALAAVVAGAIVWLNWDAWMVIPKKRAAVLGALRDPGSAQFANEKLANGGYFVCGRVNAKNGMGGYTGFQRYASSETDYFIEGSSASSTERGASTKEAIEGLDWEIQFMKTRGRVPTDQERLQAAFEKRWSKVCG